MMSTSTCADLTDLLNFVGAVLNDPGADLRPALLHVIAELARLLSDDIDERELASVLGNAPTPAPGRPTACGEILSVPGRGPAVVLAVREGGALLKVRTANEIRHIRHMPDGWADL
ncbi:hypothetical protein ACIBF7_44155 [Nonomuraea sp. NPDC050478]|uniref:hypothetical protein n=1 Tax=Nonomuraea sp. NPDC050478 TaxID=3364365 RepID=UPI0037908A1F